MADRRYAGRAVVHGADAQPQSAVAVALKRNGLTGFAATLVVTSLFESRLRAWWRGGRMQSPVAAGAQ
jgi:hypothetical protein